MKLTLIAASAAVSFAVSTGAAFSFTLATDADATDCAIPYIDGNDAAHIYDYSSKVSPNGGCQTGSSVGDVPAGSKTLVNGAGNVNADEMFGPDDWFYFGKADVNSTFLKAEDATGPAGVNFSGDALSGSWTITGVTSAIFDYFDVLVTLKDGGNKVPAGYVGYLLTSLTGTYDSPWLNSNTGEPTAAVSHVSFFFRCSSDVCGNTPRVFREPLPDPVPLPAGAWLLLGGLGAMGVASRGRRKAG